MIATATHPPASHLSPLHRPGVKSESESKSESALPHFFSPRVLHPCILLFSSDDSPDCIHKVAYFQRPKKTCTSSIHRVSILSLHISNIHTDHSDCDDPVLWLRSRGWRTGTCLISQSRYAPREWNELRPRADVGATRKLWMWSVFVETSVVWAVGWVVSGQLCGGWGILSFA